MKRLERKAFVEKRAVQTVTIPLRLHKAKQMDPVGRERRVLSIM